MMFNISTARNPGSRGMLIKRVYCSSVSCASAVLVGFLAFFENVVQMQP